MQVLTVPSAQVVTHKIQTKATVSTLDLASTTEQTVPVVSSVDFNLGGFVLDTVQHTITVPTTGYYTLSGNIALIKKSGTATNNNQNFFWQKKPAASTVWSKVGSHFQSNFLRDASGHIEVSQSLSPYCTLLNAGDMLRLRTVQVAGSGGVVTLDPSCDSYLLIDKGLLI